MSLAWVPLVSDLQVLALAVAWPRRVRERGYLGNHDNEEVSLLNIAVLKRFRVIVKDLAIGDQFHQICLHGVGGLNVLLDFSDLEGLGRGGTEWVSSTSRGSCFPWRVLIMIFILNSKDYI